MVKVLLFGELADLAGTSEVFLSERRVMDVVMALIDLYGKGFEDSILGGDQDTRAIILVNNAPVRHGVFEKELADGDTVSLMPMRGGDVL
ncbi:MAG: MoaD/ThiS family protein [Fretibacterium sp.]|nr:MoaD/ThiS family protein [Fretibacterium sp.]